MENYDRPIADLITRLSYRMPRAKVWTDAMTMIACTISNVVDGSYRAEREALYLHTAKTYREREIALISELFGTIVCALEANPNQDLLGHESISTTLIYASIADDAVKQAHKRLM